MKIRNASKSLLTTWKGHDIQPGETVDLALDDRETEWLLRHGCERVEKPKRAVTATPMPEIEATTGSDGFLRPTRKKRSSRK